MVEALLLLVIVASSFFTGYFVYDLVHTEWSEAHKCFGRDDGHGGCG